MKCPNCQYEIDDNLQTCPYCKAQLSDTAATASPQEPEKKKRTLPILSVLVLVISTVIGRYAGEKLVGQISKSKDFRSIDKFIKQVEEYKPGVLTENDYTSTHFGFRFSAGDSWIMYPKEDLAPYTQEMSASTISAAVASLEKQGVSEDLIEKYKTSFYVECEMGAAYVVDDYLYGEATACVLTGYGIEQVDDFDSYVDSIYQNLSAQSADTSTGTQVIAGTKYETISAKINVDNTDIVNTIYLAQKDYMLITIFCRAVDGYEDEVTSSFLEQFDTLD